MADPKQETSELDTLAFDLFSARCAGNQVRHNGEQEAIDSFRKAEAFLAVRSKLRKGELKPTPTRADGPQLADVCAPKRPRTDPFNMVSQQMGNLGSVAQVKAWLDQNPMPETDAEELAQRFRSRFPELQWGNSDAEVLASIGTARVIFPVYCPKK